MKSINTMNILITGAMISMILFSGGVIAGCATSHHQESTGQYIDGTVITTKVKSKLITDRYVKNLPISVTTYKNTVQLSGFVNNRYQKRRAIQIAQSVEGVATVKDSLVIKSH